jgi:hypothetical protein
MKQETIDLLRQVQAKIKAEPENFDMTDWHCGTAHCIGGWFCALAGSEHSLWELNNHFTTAEENRLCYVNYWPEQFSTAYLALCSDAWHPKPDKRKEAAEIAAQRIEHFILTEGRE